MERVVMDFLVVGGFCFAFLALTMRKTDMMVGMVMTAIFLGLINKYFKYNVFENINMMVDKENFFMNHGILVGIVFGILLLNKIRRNTDKTDFDAFLILLMFELVNIVIFKGLVNPFIFIPVYGALAFEFNKVSAYRYLASRG